MDNRFLPIPTILLEAITKSKFTILEYKILLFVILRCYMFQKTRNEFIAMSMSYIAKAQNISSGTVSNTIVSLVDRGVLLKKFMDGVNHYKVNTNIDNWNLRLGTMRIKYPKKHLSKLKKFQEHLIKRSTEEMTLPSRQNVVSEMFLYFGEDEKKIYSEGFSTIEFGKVLLKMNDLLIGEPDV